MAQITLIVVTPEKTALQTEADFVALPLFDGEIGIAPSHAPMIGRLGYGEMRLKIADKTDNYYVDGGFVQVADNVVSVLTARAIPADQLDEYEAERQLREATRQRADSDEAHENRKKALAQAFAQLRMARHVK